MLNSCPTTVVQSSILNSLAHRARNYSTLYCSWLVSNTGACCPDVWWVAFISILLSMVVLPNFNQNLSVLGSSGGQRLFSLHVLPVPAGFSPVLRLPATVQKAFGGLVNCSFKWSLGVIGSVNGRRCPVMSCQLTQALLHLLPEG